MTPRHIALIGAPLQAGSGRGGCLMGPDALRTAGLAAALAELGHTVTDHGNLAPPPPDEAPAAPHPNPAVRNLGAVAAWTAAVASAAEAAAASADMPIFLGGDHALAAGSLAGLSAHAARLGKPLFVLWLDAHPDLHTLDSTVSGNLHGTPLAYAMGLPGFAGHFPPLPVPVAPENVCLMGLRSVDPPERERIARLGLSVHDMRRIDEHGLRAPLLAFLDRVRAAGGLLHVSFDVDFLDPDIATAVATAVPGGTTFREAHLVMELLCDSGLVTSLDLVELNPFLDDRGKTARLLVDLAASLMGRAVLDRPAHRY